jgi:predicted ATPase/class 3 adenylate cyclase
MSVRCPNCSSPVRRDAKFCDECGTPLGNAATSAPASVGAEPAASANGGTAERRLVSVLFADLVGFTPLSEHRDAEEVRELLTRYFDTCRAVVTRYGGVIEKFIGDAVMAVWGAPVSFEDDAERSVRAALDLVDAVTALGAAIGEPGLRARAGVLTGDAAVTVGADAQGMVAGDLVNTAARIQSEAQPGTVLVGDATRAASDAAVVYEDMGERKLKGKAEPVALWRALRVVAMRGGAQKSEGLEAPFVGRDNDLRLMKELFHTSADQRKAHLVSVIGVAGIGKSRLCWEFSKYSDGIDEVIYTHRGRCLAYGEGVTYWALAEMVRMRADITEAEDPAIALTKLQACLREFLPDDEERRWVEPRLAQLLALEEQVTRERDELFSAWRLFFERLADQKPTVLAFEDMQWADTSLLEFIESLMEWSRNHAIFIVTAARPELIDHHPSWGAGKRNFTPLFLEPLDASAMEQLLDGLVPGLPDELREQVLHRAEGVPLYAVETVRMLLDRGLLEAAGSVYRLTGPVEDLDVPQSLHGLIAARLDGLRQETRRVLQDAAVLGKTFTPTSLAAVSGMTASEVQPLLAELVRKEVLSVQTDRRSPERGQYGFLQDLVKRVAYETLSKRDRKQKHLAVAAWFEHAWGSDESDVVEVVASHYLEAYNLAPQDPDAGRVKARASEVLAQAGERASSLAASVEAERYFAKAAELADDPVHEAELQDRAGQMAWQAGRAESATERFERAIALYDGADLARESARVSGQLADVEAKRGQIGAAIDRLRRAFAILSTGERDAELAKVALNLGFNLFYHQGAARDEALPYLDTGLDIAESLRLTGLLSRALSLRGAFASLASHPEEAEALLSHALKLASDVNAAPIALHDILNAYNNLADNYSRRDRFADALALQRTHLALATKFGHRIYERLATAEMASVLMQLGEWDEAFALVASVGELGPDNATYELLSVLSCAEIYLHRGQQSSMERLLSSFERLATSDDLQERCCYFAARAGWHRSEGRYVESLADAEMVLASISESDSISNQDAKTAFPEAVESAFALGDLEKVGGLLVSVDALRPGARSPMIEGQASRFHARLSHLRDDEPAVEPAFLHAEEIFRELALPFRLAVAQIEHAEWLTEQGRSAEAEVLGSAARAVFERLDARPWIERADAAARVGVAAER